MGVSFKEGKLTTMDWYGDLMCSNWDSKSILGENSLREKISNFYSNFSNLKISNRSDQLSI